MALLRVFGSGRGVGTGSWLGPTAVRRDLPVCALGALLLACGGSPPPVAKSPTRPAREAPQAQVAPHEGELAAARAPGHHTPAAPRPESASTPPTQARPARNVGVRGITGSLTAFEVEQAMNTRGAELLACVEKRPRALAHVAGDIAFHVDLDGQGKVERVAVTQSDIGYAPLEECLAAVVATAPFPVPAGAERTETRWNMSVDPLRKGAEPLDSAELEDTISRQAEATYEHCNIGKGRRFLVTGYLGRGRKLHPVTVRVPWRASARAQDDTPESLTCLAESLEQWTRWPKGRGYAKVSFELRWVAAPKPSKGRARARRRS